MSRQFPYIHTTTTAAPKNLFVHFNWADTDAKPSSSIDESSNSIHGNLFDARQTSLLAILIVTCRGNETASVCGHQDKTRGTDVLQFQQNKQTLCQIGSLGDTMCAPFVGGITREKCTHFERINQLLCRMPCFG